MVTWPPRTWTIQEVVTAVKMNEVRDQLRYLKGMDGPIVLEDTLLAPSAAINVASPSARFHIQEDADAYAGIVENVRSTGVPNGLLVAVDNAGATIELLSVAKGTAGGSLDKKFVVYGDGVAKSRGHDVYHSPDILSGFAVGALTFTTTPTQMPACSKSLTELGWYWISAICYFNGDGGNVGHTLSQRLYIDGSAVGPEASWTIITGDTDHWMTGLSYVYQLTAAPKTVEVRGWKSGGAGNGSGKANLHTLWCAP